jgi:hypothetical protein
VARQLLRGLRESLTIAGQVGQPVEAVNAVLHHLRTACVVVTVVAWDDLKRAAGSAGLPSAQLCRLDSGDFGKAEAG